MCLSVSFIISILNALGSFVGFSQYTAYFPCGYCGWGTSRYSSFGIVWNESFLVTLFVKIDVGIAYEQFPFRVLILVDDALTGIYIL